LYEWQLVLGNQGFDARVFMREEGALTEICTVELASIKLGKAHNAEMLELNRCGYGGMSVFGNGAARSELSAVRLQLLRVAEKKFQKDYRGGWLVFHMDLLVQGSNPGGYQEGEIQEMVSALSLMQFKADRVFLLVSDKRYIQTQ
jgi:hypothetical protein